MRVLVVAAFGAGSLAVAFAAGGAADAEPTAAAIALPEIYQGPDEAAVAERPRPKDSWLAKALQDKTFATWHHIADSRVDLSQAKETNQIGVGIKLADAERFVRFGDLTWRHRPSGRYAAALAYTAPRAAALRVAVALANFPKDLVVKFIDAGTDEPNLLASLDHAQATTYLKRGATLYWSPAQDGDTLYVELEHPDATAAGFDEERIEFPKLSYLFASGPWGAQRPGAGKAPTRTKHPSNAKAVVDRACVRDVGCPTEGISDAAKDNYARATGLLTITSSDGDSNFCTGHLLADSDTATHKPYFMTAAHCVSTANAAASGTVYWDYRAMSCGDDVAPLSSATTRGAELLATNSVQDWTLLILGAAAEPAVLPGQRYFLGWDSKPPSIGETLHHVGHSAAKPQSYARGSVTETDPEPGNMMSILWQVGATAAGASGSVFARVQQDALFARSGGLSNGTSDACASISGGGIYRYGKSDAVVPFSLVHPQVADYLGSGQTAAGGESEGATVVTLATSANVMEGDSGSRDLVFELRRSGDTAEELPFQWKVVGGDAVAGVDYQRPAANPAAGVFAADSDAATVTITVVGDKTLEPDETIWLAVENADGDVLAQGLVGVIRNDDADDHGNDRAQATSLALSDGAGSVQARVDYRGDVDYFLVAVAGSERRLLRASTFSPIYTVSGLENADGILVAANDDSDWDSDSVIARMVVPGKHYVSVRGSGGATGAYTLDVALSVEDHADTRDQATRLTLANGAGFATGVIDYAGDEDVFAITVTGKSRVRAWSTGDLDAVGILENADGETLAVDDDGGEDFNFLLQGAVRPGDYYVRVRGLFSEVGPYTLHVQLEAVVDDNETLAFSGDNLEWDLSEIFPSDKPLAYAAESSDPALATVQVVDGRLIVTANEDFEEGDVTIAITAIAADGTETQESFSIRVEPMLPSYGWRLVLATGTLRDPPQSSATERTVGGSK